MDETNLEDRPALVRRAPWSGPAMVAAGATLFALLAGLYHLDRVGFWYDEGQTVGTVDRPVGDALWRIAHWEVNQSPFHLLATAWIRLGDSEAFLRLLALGFWVGTVPLPRRGLATAYAFGSVMASVLAAAIGLVITGAW